MLFPETSYDLDTPEQCPTQLWCRWQLECAGHVVLLQLARARGLCAFANRRSINFKPGVFPLGRNNGEVGKQFSSVR